MWLLNHSSARRFEIPMLKRMGIDEIFLPKRYPDEPGFRSASIDWGEDTNLSIPAADLALLNAQDWYEGATPEAWEIANRHFDLVFFILHKARLLLEIGKHFKGLVLWRAYGLQRPLSYDKTQSWLMPQGTLRNIIERLGPRFYFAEAYPHLADSEPDYLRRRRLYLPLGLGQSDQPPLPWQGGARQILFVCPDLGINSFYADLYKAFRKDFGDLPYVVAGAQPIRIDDSRVLGFVSQQQHEYNMTQSRVMYYHSSEPNHIHYHPFEAVRAGMPLVYMAGGMLDRMGGSALPGRCETVRQARRMIERILGNDRRLIDRILATQPILLEGMQPERCEPAWREGLQHLRESLDACRQEHEERPLPTRRKRIAVCLPVAYGGGSLRAAVLLARALRLGSRQAGEECEIVLLHPDAPEYTLEADERFAGCPPDIRRRPFNWRLLEAAEARRAMHYAGYSAWEPDAERYCVIDDGIRQLQDCDLWVLVSDRVSAPLLPLKPIVLMVYDYLQRYEKVLPPGADLPFIGLARRAERVLVTTDFTRHDAEQYAGVDPRRVSRVPMLVPERPTTLDTSPLANKDGDYFLWTTNAALHKNHVQAAKALEIYYEELDGQLDCWVTGEDTEQLLDGQSSHLKEMAALVERNETLRERLLLKGRLSERRYWRALGNARFLWHPARIDNGTFSALEAAQLGVPTLSSDYPAMREIDIHFALNLAWMDSGDPHDMALQLKRMEQQVDTLRSRQPGGDVMAPPRLEDLASLYWQEIRECL